jgi:hypothetical protein
LSSEFLPAGPPGNNCTSRGVRLYQLRTVTSAPLLARSQSHADLHSLHDLHSLESPAIGSIIAAHRSPWPQALLIRRNITRIDTASYLREPRWPLTAAILQPHAPFDGNTTPSSKTQAWDWRSPVSQHWQMELCTHTFPAHASSSSRTEQAPKEYLGELQQHHQRRAIWLTTGDDK